jgi:hypothetical protein
MPLVGFGLWKVPAEQAADTVNFPRFWKSQILEVTDFDLQIEETMAISTLDKGLRFNDPSFYLETVVPLFA